MTSIVIALGGALGALSRYELSLWISDRWTHFFPLPTFIINVSGAFLLGFINVLFLDKLSWAPEWRLGIGVGFLGAFTTFSTFGFEIFTLIEKGYYSTAISYVLLSTLVGLFGVSVGVTLARWL
ncbi:camphor resistance protein CrcB [Desulfitobacterium dichloroeliminans LMG P-21439]|uniref:Fluoride-specific ion channel FluC n=1 Tax=Desulfitobacterium dichloroeliminans (strain LMG P-21439 / DCA1) TaxID=871963 RepID=L0F682_DESDL|nr:fluoride efflux transporter CrcB [Desulfitobacterium dichloroeliminans]AGA68468.1 camphor resistance protein CrcB [Desulfitobacterium dichloroeliminans LMG P-21439]